MKHIFILVVDTPDNVSAEEVKLEVEEAFDDSTLWNATVTIMEPHEEI